MVVLGEGTVSYERGTPVAHTASRSLVTQEVQLVTSNYSTKPCSTGFGVAQADPPCRSSGVLVSINAGFLGKEVNDAPPARPKTAHAASRSLVTQEVLTAQETPLSWDPTIGLYPGSYGGLRERGCFL